MFRDLPRYFGNPSQIYVTNKKALDNLIRIFNGKSPVFVSTYQFPTREQPIVDMSVFDIDSRLNLRIPYKDTRNLKKFCDKNGIPYIIDFSGGKGFHFFLIHEPEKGTDETKDKMYSIQLSLINHLDIQAIDVPTIGRLRWLIRYPTSRYIRFKREKEKKMKILNNNLYCRYIPPEEFEEGIQHIIKMAEEPGKVPKRPKPKQTMNEIIKMIPKFKMRHRYNGNDNLELMQSADKTLMPTLASVGLPCLQKIAQLKHPTHYERIELVAWLKSMGYRDIAIVGFIKQLPWTDFDYKKTSENVASIKPRFPKCRWLSDRYNLCENCSMRK